MSIFSMTKTVKANAEKNKQPLFVPILVVLEVIWVLQSAYDVSRQDIVMALGNLLQMPSLEFKIKVHCGISLSLLVNPVVIYPMFLSLNPLYLPDVKRH